jgi:hypothetical protein
MTRITARGGSPVRLVRGVQVTRIRTGRPRSVSVFARASSQKNGSTVEQQMQIGGCHVDAFTADGLTVDGVLGTQRARPSKDLGEKTDIRSREVMQDKDRRCGVRGEATFDKLPPETHISKENHRRWKRRAIERDAPSVGGRGVGLTSFVCFP